MESLARKITKSKLKNFIFDVDGVFNTGQFLYTKDGKYAKIFGPHDADGIKIIRPHLNICCISADKRGWLITKKRIADDMGLRLEMVPEQQRFKWLKDNFKLSESIYMADGIWDAKIFPEFAYSIAPHNAFYLAREQADFVTNSNAGEGAVAEACIYVLNNLID